MSKFVLHAKAENQWKWSFVADNSTTIAVSSETYQSEAECRATIALLQSQASQSSDFVVEPAATKPTPTPTSTAKQDEMAKADALHDMAETHTHKHPRKR